MPTSFVRALVAALLVIPHIAARAETHRFEPTRFHNTFSFGHEPILRIKPGDHVITKTIDARGYDAANNKVQLKLRGSGNAYTVQYSNQLEPTITLRPTSRRTSLAPFTDRLTAFTATIHSVSVANGPEPTHGN